MATSEAPAFRYCRTSSADRTPPTPMIGVSPIRSAMRETASTPIGRSAGPLTPPLPLPSLVPPFTENSRPGMVFTALIPSAPASRAVIAMPAISGRTGKIELERSHARTAVQLANDLGVLLGSKANHVDDDMSTVQPRGQPGKKFIPDSSRPRVSQPHRVEHATREFRRSGSGVAGARVPGHGLRNDSSEPVQIYHSG